jgi:hypothetical protein
MTMHEDSPAGAPPTIGVIPAQAGPQGWHSLSETPQQRSQGDQHDQRDDQHSHGDDSDIKRR